MASLARNAHLRSPTERLARRIVAAARKRVFVID
jgi:hypothetical protein